jgi:acetyl esterase/lipase
MVSGKIGFFSGLRSRGPRTRRSGKQLNLIRLALLIASSHYSEAQPKIIQLYHGPAPGSEQWTWQEQETDKNPLNTKISYNVTRPSLTIFPANRAVANGTSVIVFPGGAFRVLLIEKEGFAIARALTQKGITVFVLKYRLARSLSDDPWGEMIEKGTDATKSHEELAPVRAAALEDAKAAIKYVREHASEFQINPELIGVMGSSAGGTLAAMLAYDYTALTRPAFVATIYAATSPVKRRAIARGAPPMFIAAASDDERVPVSDSLDLYTDWLAAKQSVELHLYAKGNHGLQGFPAENWLLRFTDWLVGHGFSRE